MGKKIIGWLLLTMVATSSFGGTAQRNNVIFVNFADSASISLVTCAADSRNMLTSFGHCAVRVYNSRLNIDVVCDYGALEIQNDWSGLSFLKNFSLGNPSVRSFSAFRLNYSFFGRQTFEQSLNLSSKERQRLLSRLQSDFSSQQNQSYRYHYFKNNCATLLRDAIVSCLDTREIFLETKTQHTYRNLLKPYWANQWIDIVANISLGTPADRRLSKSEAMFLPATLKLELETNNLVKPINVIEKKKDNFDLWPVFTFTIGGLALALLSVLDLKRKRLMRIIDSAIWLMTGLSGLILVLLWLLFKNTEMGWNFNLIWLMPFNLFAFWLPPAYFKTLGFLHIALALGWFWLPQEIPLVLIPFIVGLGIRQMVVGVLKSPSHNLAQK